MALYLTCYHFWAGAPSCYLQCYMNYKNRYMGILAVHLKPLKPLAHHQNVASLSLNYFGRGHPNWLNLFQFLILEGGLLFILIDCLGRVA